jgi:hypothetical protein
LKEELNLSGLAVPVVKRLKSYLIELITIIGKPLDSIVAYGSAVTSEFDAKRSNINLIVVVDELDIGLIHKVQSLVKRGARKGIVAPLFLTHEHMDTSSDVFPIEFLDMSDFHHTIYGDDPFDTLTIGTENLRLECEEKLKGSLINLRQSYLEIADRRSAMMELISASITGIVSVFRGLIRLAGSKAPAGKKAVILRMTELYPVEPANFLTALEVKLSAPRMKRDEMDAFFAAYHEDIEALAMHVDKLSRTRTRNTLSRSTRNTRNTSLKKKKAVKPRKSVKKPAAKSRTKKATPARKSK